MSTINLTEREKEVLKLISQAMSNKEIGEKLFISSRTVERHIENMCNKIGVFGKNNRVALVSWKYENNTNG